MWCTSFRNGKFALTHKEYATRDKGRNQSDTFTKQDILRLIENHQKLEKKEEEINQGRVSAWTHLDL